MIIVRIDGSEPWAGPLDEFVASNEDLAELDDVLALAIGESCICGGGAFAEVIVTRLEDDHER
jgi:hypothetical protein